MAERLNIVQSSTEPNKRDIWLKNGKFKKFGSKGWEDVGGGSIDESTLYVFNYTGQDSVTQDEYNELKDAIDGCRVILLCLEDSGNFPVCAAYNEYGDGITICGVANGVLMVITIASNLSINIEVDNLVSSSFLETSLDTKQDTITDLKTIRANAALGAKALQSVPTATSDTLGGVKQVTISQLAKDANLTSVIATYNDLVTQLVASGIAVASV
nr:MAG TPA: Head fiber protein [Crassvirales sp.]